MIIKILGSGCPKCLLLDEQAKQAVTELGLENEIKVEHIFDIAQITEYGVMSTPAIVIDEQVKATSRIPDKEEIKTWLK